MSLTIRYLDLSYEDFSYLRDSLGSYEVHFFKVDNATVLTANADMSEMLKILQVTSKFKHQDFSLRQS